MVSLSRIPGLRYRSTGSIHRRIEYPVLSTGPLSNKKSYIYFRRNE